MQDPAVVAQRFSFGASGHPGSLVNASFNEWHVLAITQAISRYRNGKNIDGPLFLGITGIDCAASASTSWAMARVAGAPDRSGPGLT